MLLIIHNLPIRTQYADVKDLIASKCGLRDCILDNLEVEGNGLKVTVGVSEEEDAAILVRKINGLYYRGQQLYVENKRQKKDSEQPYRTSVLQTEYTQPVQQVPQQMFDYNAQVQAMGMYQQLGYMQQMQAAGQQNVQNAFMAYGVPHLMAPYSGQSEFGQAVVQEPEGRFASPSLDGGHAQIDGTWDAPRRFDKAWDDSVSNNNSRRRPATSPPPTWGAVNDHVQKRTRWDSPTTKQRSDRRLNLSRDRYNENFQDETRGRSGQHNKSFQDETRGRSGQHNNSFQDETRGRSGQHNNSFQDETRGRSGQHNNSFQDETRGRSGQHNNSFHEEIRGRSGQHSDSFQEEKRGRPGQHSDSFQEETRGRSGQHSNSFQEETRGRSGQHNNNFQQETRSRFSQFYNNIQEEKRGGSGQHNNSFEEETRSRSNQYGQSGGHISTNRGVPSTSHERDHPYIDQSNDRNRHGQPTERKRATRSKEMQNFKYQAMSILLDEFAENSNLTDEFTGLHPFKKLVRKTIYRRIDDITGDLLMESGEICERYRQLYPRTTDSFVYLRLKQKLKENRDDYTSYKMNDYLSTFVRGPNQQVPTEPVELTWKFPGSKEQIAAMKKIMSEKYTISLTDDMDLKKPGPPKKSLRDVIFFRIGEITKLDENMPCEEICARYRRKYPLSGDSAMFASIKREIIEKEVTQKYTYTRAFREFLMQFVVQDTDGPQWTPQSNERDLRVSQNMATNRLMLEHTEAAADSPVPNVIKLGLRSLVQLRVQEVTQGNFMMPEEICVCYRMRHPQSTDSKVYTDIKQEILKKGYVKKDITARRMLTEFLLSYVSQTPQNQKQNFVRVTKEIVTPTPKTASQLVAGTILLDMLTKLNALHVMDGSSQLKTTLRKAIYFQVEDITQGKEMDTEEILSIYWKTYPFSSHVQLYRKCKKKLEEMGPKWMCSQVLEFNDFLKTFVEPAAPATQDQESHLSDQLTDKQMSLRSQLRICVMHSMNRLLEGTKSYLNIEGHVPCDVHRPQAELLTEKPHLSDQLTDKQMSFRSQLRICVMHSMNRLLEGTKSYPNIEEELTKSDVLKRALRRLIILRLRFTMNGKLLSIEDICHRYRVLYPYEGERDVYNAIKKKIAEKGESLDLFDNKEFQDFLSVFVDIRKSPPKAVTENTQTSVIKPISPEKVPEQKQHIREPKSNKVNPTFQKAIDAELLLIDDLIKKELDNPQNEVEKKFSTDQKGCIDKFKKAVVYHLSNRITNCGRKQCRLFCSPRMPKRYQLENLLAEYNYTSLKKSDDSPYYVAGFDNYDTVDMLCNMGHAILSDDIKVTFKYIEMTTTPHNLGQKHCKMLRRNYIASLIDNTQVNLLDKDWQKIEEQVKKHKEEKIKEEDTNDDDVIVIENDDNTIDITGDDPSEDMVVDECDDEIDFTLEDFEVIDEVYATDDDDDEILDKGNEIDAHDKFKEIAIEVIDDDWDQNGEPWSEDVITDVNNGDEAAKNYENNKNESAAKSEHYEEISKNDEEKNDECDETVGVDDDNDEIGENEDIDLAQVDWDNVDEDDLEDY